MFNLQGKNIAIITHRSLMPIIPGNDLKKFSLEHGCNALLFIAHPLLLLKESYKLSSKYESYEKSKLTKKSKAYHWKLPESLSYIKDFIYTIFWILSSGQTYDFYFGMNNLNASAGLVLKKLGRVKKVVYYSIDLYPQRFRNNFINWVYHKLDNFCVKSSDETWNVSPYLAEWRKKQGMTGKSFTRQFIVPIGIWFNDMKRVSPKKINFKKIVYVGHLKNFYGVDLIIRSIPLIKKEIPDVKLEIIGGGEQSNELKQLTKKLQVNSSVNFLGWKEKKEAEKLIADAAVGLAPFNTKVDEKIKNADPAKIKDYLALGLPIVMTNATINAGAIGKAKCGVIVDYTPESLSQEVCKLLLDKKLQKEYRTNALEYAKQFDWNKIFAKNISRLI